MYRLNSMEKIRGEIKFTAKVFNRNSDLLTIYGEDNFEEVISINKNEVFEAQFLAQQGIYTLYDGKESVFLYLKANFALEIEVNAKEFYDTIKYKGQGANENNFIVQRSLSDHYFFEQNLNKDIETFLVLLEAKKVSEMHAIETGDLDTDFKKEMISWAQNFKEYALLKHESGLHILNLKDTLSPDFNYENCNGGETSLSQFKGKYVYIKVWATYCEPCFNEIPYFQKLIEKYHRKNIEFVSISIDELVNHDKWMKMIDDIKPGGIQLFSNDSLHNTDFMNTYHINTIPRFILIDPSGNIVNADADRPSSAELQIQLDSLLK